MATYTSGAGLDAGILAPGGIDTIDTNLPLHLTKQRRKYFPLQDRHLRNNLMIIVGYLEFFNALDFPANVWNQTPVPVFAQGLMITGGSVALIGSIFAILDFRRSLRNVRLLVSERRFIRNEIEFATWKGTEVRYLQAWLSVNFRELGWELIDRMLQDALIGFASVLVGTGTIMAVGGANPRIYLASNLLSGYIGNGFVALYALFSAAWSVYLYQRARRHKALVQNYLKDPAVYRRGTQVFRYHQIYAVLNAATLLTSGAGSLISSTHPWGYFILIPCVFSSVFSNVFWRFRVGYSRILLPFRSYAPMDIYSLITTSIATQEKFRSKEEIHLDQLSRGSLVALIYDNEMLEDLCILLANTKNSQKFLLKTGPKNLTVDRGVLENIDYTILLGAVRTCVRKFVVKRALDKERMLYEFLGSYLTVDGTQSSPKAAERVSSGGEANEPSPEKKEETTKSSPQPESDMAQQSEKQGDLNEATEAQQNSDAETLDVEQNESEERIAKEKSVTEPESVKEAEEQPENNEPSAEAPSQHTKPTPAST